MNSIDMYRCIPFKNRVNKLIVTICHQLSYNRGSLNDLEHQAFPAISILGYQVELTERAITTEQKLWPENKHWDYYDM